MRILLDACVPRGLMRFLSCQATTAQEMGWGALKNGDLLRRAEAEFDALISTDQNLKYQQRVIGRKIAILILPTNNWPTIRTKGTHIAEQASKLQPGDFLEVQLE